MGQTARTDLRHSEAVDGEQKFELRGVETETRAADPDTATLASSVGLDRQRVESIAENAETAIVDVTVRFLDGETVDESQESWAVATENGNWRLLGQAPESGSTPVTPTTNFEFDYQAEENAVTVTATDGDQPQANRLFVRGTDIAAGSEGVVHQIEGSEYGPEDRVQIGNRFTVEVTSESFEIRLVWEDSDEGVSAILAEYTGLGA